MKVEIELPPFTSKITIYIVFYGNDPWEAFFHEYEAIDRKRYFECQLRDDPNLFNIKAIQLHV